MVYDENMVSIFTSDVESFVYIIAIGHINLYSIAGNRVVDVVIRPMTNVTMSHKAMVPISTNQTTNQKVTIITTS